MSLPSPAWARFLAGGATGRPSLRPRAQDLTPILARSTT